jgi:hypothetical protein
MAMINDPSNHQLLERDLKYAFWQFFNRAVIAAASAVAVNGKTAITVPSRTH